MEDRITLSPVDSPLMNPTIAEDRGDRSVGILAGGLLLGLSAFLLVVLLRPWILPIPRDLALVASLLAGGLLYAASVLSNTTRTSRVLGFLGRNVSTVLNLVVTIDVAAQYAAAGGWQTCLGGCVGIGTYFLSLIVSHSTQ